MKFERLMKMLPAMFIVYSVGMFVICGAVLGEGKERSDTLYQEEAVVSPYITDNEM